MGRTRISSQWLGVARWLAVVGMRPPGIRQLPGSSGPFDCIVANCCARVRHGRRPRTHGAITIFVGSALSLVIIMTVAAMGTDARSPGSLCVPVDFRVDRGRVLLALPWVATVLPPASTPARSAAAARRAHPWVRPAASGRRVASPHSLFPAVVSGLARPCWARGPSHARPAP
jgi:hypothetical protein